MPITLLTDFGARDTYVGQMKGVIAQLAPNETVIDLTHEVPPQDLVAAAIALDCAVDAFPRNTIHIAVIDPGVGSARRGIAARSEQFTLVGPDNGLFTAVWQRYPPKRIVALTNPQYHGQRVSATFHGRDVFAPAAAHLATGAPLAQLGETVDTPVRLDLPEPQRKDDHIELAVLHVDHFGNLITNMPAAQLAEYKQCAITVGQTRIDELHTTFSDVPEGAPVAYLGSSDRLELAIRNGNAAQQWRINAGDTLRFHPQPQ